ncbi:MAG: hypothetical protein JW881_20190 [Spirochaetales bacterium]|nr:hypothetical protein [Spirochaetales bacterium]
MEKNVVTIIIGIIAVTGFTWFNSCEDIDFPNKPKEDPSPPPSRDLVVDIEKGGTLDFGTVLWEGTRLHDESDVSEVVSRHSITITNQDKDPLIISEVAIEQPEINFTVTTSLPLTVLPETDTAITFDFKPADNGIKSAVVSIIPYEKSIPPYLFSLRGKGNRVIAGSGPQAFTASTASWKPNDGDVYRLRLDMTLVGGGGAGGDGGSGGKGGQGEVIVTTILRVPAMRAEMAVAAAAPGERDRAA